MNEKQLQHRIVMWFSQQYPEHRGMFFLVNNNTMSNRHGQSQKALGLVKGVADMILITPLGKVAGIEFKAPGATHNRSHIENQVEWGNKLIQSGGYYIISPCENSIRVFIIAIMLDWRVTAKSLQDASLKSVTDQDGKTIKF